MTRPFLRVNLSSKDADFRSLAIEPGVPVLSKSGAAGTLLRRWLGRFAGDTTWHADTLQYFVCDDDGCRYADIEPHLATHQDLKGKLKREFAELKTRLEQAVPESSSARAFHRFLRESLPQPRRGKGGVDLKCQFFKYRDVHDQWRLLWCPGLQPTIEDRPTTTVICKNPDCRQLALSDGNPDQSCRRCETLFHPKVVRRRSRRWVALVLLLLMVAAGAVFYLLPREVLSGRVICAADGSPVSGAEIRANGRPAVTSNEDGVFRIEGLSKGIVELEISASGYRQQSLERELRAGEEDSAEIRLVGSRDLSGNVIHVLGTREIPVAGARVTFGSEEGTLFETDTAGTFVLPGVPPKPLKLNVSADGFLPATLDVEPAEEEPLRIVLRGSGKIVGTVVHSADKSQPIPGAQVVVEGIEQATSQTDKEGRFELSGVPPGPVQVTAMAAGFRESAVRTKISEEPLQVALAGDAILAGSALRADTNQPAAGARVVVTGTPFQAIADEKGQFRLEDVCSGKAHIEGTVSGLSATAEEDLQPKRVTSIQLVLKGDVEIQGRVVSALDQSPIAGAEVAVAKTQLRSQTAADGRFTLDGICAGEVQLQVSAESYAPQDVTRELKSGQQKLEDLSLNPITSVAGRVVRALDQQPVANAEVRIEGLSLATRTKEDGNFVLADVPAGRKRILAAAPGYVPQQIEQNLMPGKHQVEEIALIGDSDLKGVVLTIGKDGKKLAIPKAALDVVVGGFRTKLASADNGGFAVGKVPAGNVGVTARAEGYRETVVSQSIAADKPWIEVVMKPLIDARGVVVDASDHSKPIGQAAVRVTAGGTVRKVTSGDDGGFAAAQLPSEIVEVHVQAEGYRDTQTTKRIDPDVAWLEVEMAPLVAVQGAVVRKGTNRLPVSNASVRVSVDGMTQQVTSEENGAISLQLPLGEAEVVAEAPGYAKASLRKMLLQDDLWLEIPMSPGVNATGTVVNAVNKEPVTGAKVTVISGDVKVSDTTRQDGHFEVAAIPVGPATVQVSHPEFEPAEVSYDAAENAPLQIVLSPKVPKGEARVVLTWAARPRDLDGHLCGTSSDGSRFHISFKTPKASDAKLDVDAKEGLGPETITIKVRPGKYEYYVVHPENIGTSDGGGLVASRAQVRVYYAGSESTQPFVVPKEAGGPVWHAINIMVDQDRHITVSPANEWLLEVPQ